MKQDEIEERLIELEERIGKLEHTQEIVMPPETTIKKINLENEAAKKVSGFDIVADTNNKKAEKSKKNLDSESVIKNDTI